MPLAGLGRLPGGYKRGLLITSNSPDLAPLAAQLQQGLHRVQWGPLPPPPDFKRASRRLFTPPVRQSHKTKDLVQTRSFNVGAEHSCLSPVPVQAAPSLSSSVHPKILGFHLHVDPAREDIVPLQLGEGRGQASCCLPHFSSASQICWLQQLPSRCDKQGYPARCPSRGRGGAQVLYPLCFLPHLHLHYFP